jgi:Cd2+/Zn2+-exporting ATPase
VVRPGERVPVDGRVVRGSSFVDQAAVTGEPVPVRREPGNDVFAGTINQNGVLEVEVEKPASETMLSRIICSVEEAQAKKTSFQRFSDSFGTYYTPAMFVLGVLVATVPPLFFGAEWAPFIYRGLVVFVVSCSCGLALSVPVAVVAAMANAARHGTVFKGGAYLEAVDRVKVIAFDKTGTLTIGRPEVTDVLGFGGIRGDKVLELAASIESRSRHPLANAIVRKVKESGKYSGQPAEDVRETAGLGVTGTVGGRSCVVGSPRYQQENGVPIDEVGDEAVARFENDGKTVVMVSTDSKLIGLLAIADNVRPGAVDALQRLHRAGIRTIMLTGDNERCARAIANQAGVDEYYAQLLPTDKVDVVRRLRDKYGPVAMVGDGINDAPAMAVSDVGIAMGAAGTDIAIEAGDIVLMSDDISKIGYIRELSRRAIGTIRQNIAISLINIAFMVIAALLGYLGLVTGLLLNEASALLVIANALRLLKWKSKADVGISMVAGATVPDHDKPEPDKIELLTTVPPTGESCCAGEEPLIRVLNQIPLIDRATVSCCSDAAQPAEASAPTSVIDATEVSCCCSCEAQPTEAHAPVPEIQGANVPGGLEIATFRIEGLSCSCEGQIVEKRVKSLRGIAAFSLNAITNQLKVSYDPSIVSIPDIETAVKKAGGTAMPVRSK